MLRLGLGVVVGIVVGFAIVMGGEALGHRVFPPPGGVDFTDPVAVKAMIAGMPVAALIMLVVGWAVAAFAASAVALLVSQRDRRAGFIASGVVLAATVANLLMLPHPLWVSVTAVVGIGLAALAADRLLARRA
ncbi:MAG: hypothetical protein Q8L66_08040 [Caulobacter sp.]|nr:hypothetical protein [Caulobacter sp.]